jgi:hypothetical protein
MSRRIRQHEGHQRLLDVRRTVRRQRELLFRADDPDRLVRQPGDQVPSVLVAVTKAYRRVDSRQPTSFFSDQRARPAKDESWNKLR